MATLAALDRSAAAVAAAGLTADDLLAIRVEVARESYSDAFMDELAREHRRVLRDRERMRSESLTPLPL